MASSLHPPRSAAPSQARKDEGLTGGPAEAEMQAGQPGPRRAEMGDDRLGVTVRVDSLGGLIAVIDRFFQVPPECLRLGPRLCVEESSPGKNRQLEHHRHAEDLVSPGDEVRREEVQAAGQGVVLGGRGTFHPGHIPISRGALGRQRRGAEADGASVDEASSVEE